jgi:hypothetical protein
MKKQSLSCFLLGTLIIGMTLSLTLPASATQDASFSNTLSVGGIELITLRGESDESVKERSSILEDRLIPILADSKLVARDVRIKMLSSCYAIYVKGRLFVTITTKDAAYNQTTPEKQALTWRRQLAKTLPLVKVTAPKN